MFYIEQGQTTFEVGLDRRTSESRRRTDSLRARRVSGRVQLRRRAVIGWAFGAPGGTHGGRTEETGEECDTESRHRTTSSVRFCHCVMLEGSGLEVTTVALILVRQLVHR